MFSCPFEDRLRVEERHFPKEIWEKGPWHNSSQLIGSDVSADKFVHI